MDLPDHFAPVVYLIPLLDFLGNVTSIGQETRHKEERQP